MQTVIVTGAAGRLGRFVVNRFAEEGAAIAAVVLDEAEASSVALPDDGASRTFIADTTDEEDVASIFDQVATHFGHIDALVHTVGGWDARPLLDTKLIDFNRLVRLNLHSTFLCFREAARHMRRRGGRLIAFASGQGADGGVAEQIAYSAGKAGVVRLVEAVADEYNGTGLTAHAIAPSLILYGEADEGDDGVAAEQIADLCAYLCTDAGDALNGAVLRAFGTLR